jgi:hypothetical protein
MLYWMPPSFDIRIKYCITTLAEHFNVMPGIKVTSNKWTDVETFFGHFSRGYLSPEIQQNMKDHGWCPSEIESAKARFTGLQTVYMLSRMDKSIPAHDHSKCTKEFCTTYQIDMSSYQLVYAIKACECSEIEVRSEAIAKILEVPYSVPLLKIVPGQLQIELVQSSSDTPYVAVSHEWADGLGNPISNSLHRCQMVRLKKMVDELQKSTGGQTIQNEPDTTSAFVSSPLLWLDTLCCPAIDGPGKQKVSREMVKWRRYINHNKQKQLWDLTFATESN